MQRFIGKKPYKKYVRPMCNSSIRCKVVESNTVNNNIDKKDTIDMNEKIEQIESVLDVNKVPKRKTKIEKKDKGLYERTEESTILLTEDNKMLLND